MDDITRLVLMVDELSGENAESLKEWIRLIATAVGGGILITENAETVYTEWRHRPQIEHTYRFEQKAGLDVEDVRVQTLERMRRIFASVLLAALFVYHIAHAWPQHMACGSVA